MTDRELLELAAKAAGYQIHSDAWARVAGGGGETLYMGNNGPAWSPLTDDGDALRLAGVLGLVVDCSRPSAGEPFKLQHYAQDNFADKRAAIRRAIVRAAAEVGKAMP